MWTALAIRLFVVIRRTVSVTFKAVKPGRCVRPPRPPADAVQAMSEAELARLHAKIGQLVIEKATILIADSVRSSVAPTRPIAGS
jgi:hypothetical protein